MGNEHKPLIQVVERALELMEMLAGSGESMRATDIARRMELPLQTVNNLLRTLYRRGYLSQDSRRCYRLGPQCFYLGSFADRWSALRDAVAVPLAQLVETTRLTGFVGVIENDKLLCVALLSPGRKNVGAPPQFWADELHATACGRVLLAALPESERRKLLARTARRKLTGRTVVDGDELHRLCRQVAEAGFAEVCDESRPEVSSLAIPLAGADGRTYAGLAISGGDRQWRQMTVEEKLESLHVAAAGISYRNF